MRIILVPLLVCFLSITNAQSIEELFKNNEYNKIIQKAKKPKKLSGLELSLVGYSYSMLLDHKNAITFFDLSFDKGYDHFYSHFLKGYSFRNLKQYNNALVEVRKALKNQPNNQELVSEIGLIFYDQNKLDSAIFYFKKASNLENTFPEPYYWLGHIYDEQQNYTEAIKYYNQASVLLTKGSHYQIKSEQRLAKLKYWFSKNYKSAILTYKELLKSDSTNFEFLSQIMLAYNSNKQYQQADSIFKILKLKHKNNELPEFNMKYGNVFFSQRAWGNYNIVIRKSFKEPTELIAPYFKIYIYDSNNEKILRRFIVEKSFQIDETKPKYRLCEHTTNGSHQTQPYGWIDGNIPLKTLEEAIIETLKK